MESSRIRWIITVFVMLFFLILIGWGLFRIVSSLFSSSGSEVAVEQVKGDDIEDIKSAYYIVEGPVEATSEQRSYEIEVSSNVVSMKVFSNYGQTVIGEKNYKNNEKSYDTFLAALNSQNIASRVKDTDEDQDYEEVGRCPLGERFIVGFADNLRRWTTSCKSVPGTAGGNMTNIGKLFDAQIPEDDYKELVKGTGL